MTHKFKIQVEIPDLLMEKILSIDYKSTKSKSYVIKLAAILIYGFNEEDGSDYNDFYKPMSSSYIRDKITSHPFYVKYFVNQLQENLKEGKKENRIFQTDGIYSVGHFPLHYRINPHLMSGSFKEYEVEIELECLNDIFPEVINHFNDSMRLIKPMISRNEMAKQIEQQSFQMCLTPINGFSAIYYSNFLKDSANGLGNFKLKDRIKLMSNNSDFASIVEIEKEINLLNNNSGISDHILIIEINKKNKNKFRIGQIDEFFEFKKKRFISIVNKKVDGIYYGNWNPIISSTNGRFNHGFTNINKFCIDFFSFDGQEIDSYDLKSSQPTILANLLIQNPKLLDSIKKSKFKKLVVYMEKNVDVFFNLDSDEWFQDFINNDIYRSIAKELGLMTRAESKKGMMMLFFTEPGYHSPLINPLKNLFPEYANGLIDAKDSFKKNYQSSKKTFPVFLQLVEAHIFIEIIYPELAKAGIPALTKHDSILFPKSRFLEIQSIVADCFDKIGFVGKMELEKTASSINIWPDWYKPTQNEDELFNE